ncbi:MAG: class I SAM-dependent methyltransferase [Thermodesulfobacteriota bacterium]
MDARTKKASRTSVPSAPDPFVLHHQRYDNWFERHRAAYLSELLAVRALLPWEGRGLEIGVGTGRFAAPLGVTFGIDPAAGMLEHARRRGVRLTRGVAEALPFQDAIFDYALAVTSICFVDNPLAMLQETARVLRPGGTFVVGLVDRESPLGQHYLAHQAESPFYRDAHLFSPAEVEDLLALAGFGPCTWLQTLFSSSTRSEEVEPARAGTGDGAFLAGRARIGTGRKHTVA